MVLCLSSLTPTALAFSKSDTEVNKPSSTSYSESTEFDGIYKSVDGQYAMKVSAENSSKTLTRSSESIFIPVERIDIPFSDTIAVRAFVNRTDIPAEIINDFQDKYESYLNSNSKEKENVHATLFAPAANGNPDVILKYTYNGYPMQTYQFNYTNCSTGWKDVKKGAGTKDKVKLIKDVAITIGSALSTKLSYFSTGKSIWDSFAAYYKLSDNSVSTDTKDYFEARLVWDQVTKYTYTNMAGEWECGLVTYKVNIRTLGQETYFSKSGKGPYNTETAYNTVCSSPHFNDPWATAFNNGRYTVRENISWSTGDVKYDFG